MLIVKLIIKANRDTLSEIITCKCNEGISTAKFPDILKSADVEPVFEGIKSIKKITDL